MTRDTSKRAAWRMSQPKWHVMLVAAALAGLTACAPLPQAASQGQIQSQSQIQSGNNDAQASALNTQQAPAQTTLAPAAQGPLPIPPNLLPLTQPAGQKRLMSSAYNASYWPLAQYFETQRNEAYCSVATSVMALNALGVQRPASSLYPDFPFFTQQDFFRGIDPQVANAAQVSREGMTLDQLGSALSTFPVDVTKIHGADLTLERFRDVVRETVARHDRFALLNFGRTEIGESGGGHWSPLAAYDAASDSALLLDVARYKYPAMWVPLAKLYAGAVSVDKVSGLSRGLLIVSKRAQ